MEKSDKIFSQPISHTTPSDPIGEQLRDITFEESRIVFEDNSRRFTSAKLAVNNFLKTTDEIESEFLHIIKDSRSPDDEIWTNMEQNY